MAVPRSDSVLTKRHEIEDNGNIGTEKLHRRTFDIGPSIHPYPAVDQRADADTVQRTESIFPAIDSSASQMGRTSHSELSGKGWSHFAAAPSTGDPSLRRGVGSDVLSIGDPYPASIPSPMNHEGSHAHGYARTEGCDGCRFVTSGYDRSYRSMGSVMEERGSDGGESPVG